MTGYGVHPGGMGAWEKSCIMSSGGFEREEGRRRRKQEEWLKNNFSARQTQKIAGKESRQYILLGKRGLLYICALGTKLN